MIEEANALVSVGFENNADGEKTVEWKDFLDKLPQDARIKFVELVTKEDLTSTIEKMIANKQDEASSKKVSGFFEELEKEYRDENYCPSHEDIRGMKKDTLMIMTKNALYVILRDCLSLKERILKGKIGHGEVMKIVDQLWESRNSNPDGIQLIEGERYEEARAVLGREKRGPFSEQDWNEYKRLEKENSYKNKKKTLERDKRKYEEMTMRFYAWQRTDECRKIEQEKEEAEKVLSRYGLNNENVQRDVQITLSQELSRLTGKEAGEVFEEVLMHWILNADSRSSIGDEEILIEFYEAVDGWKKSHDNDPAIDEISPELIEKAELLTKHFWDFYTNIVFDVDWAEETNTLREAKIKQFLMVTKMMADLRKRTRL